MNKLLEFMTSEEMLIVGVIILTASILALVVFLIEKNYYKRKQKNNTKQINKIVEEEQDNIVEDKKEVIPITNSVEVVPVSFIETSSNNQIEVLGISDKVVESSKEETPLVIPIEEFNEEYSLNIKENSKEETLDLDNDIKEEVVQIKEKQEEKNSIESIYQEVKEEVEQLQYTDPEPNKEEAKEELRKATEALIEQENRSQESNIDLTKFEAEQEENAIISLDELMKKSEVLYEQNEVAQYQDEGNEPISLEDLEQRMKNIKVEIEQLDQEEKEILPSLEEVKENIVVEVPTVKLDDFNTVKDSTKAYREDIVFKSSPIISPIFGIEEHKNDSNLELENTANYDKLDEEIKKTNQFLATLKELQKNLE